jgi:uncharacterized membrane protein
VSGTRPPWGTALLVYAAYRRTIRKVGGKHRRPAQTLFVTGVVLMLVMPIAGPILWHALVTMPTVLVMLIGAAIVFRVVRWFLRRYR